MAALIAIANTGGVNIEWLAAGQGPMRPEPQAEAPPPAAIPPETPPPDLVQDSDEFPPEDLPPDAFWALWSEFVHESPARRGWLQIELPKRFKEFSDWLKKRRRLDRQKTLVRSEAVGQ